MFFISFQASWFILCYKMGTLSQLWNNQSSVSRRIQFPLFFVFLMKHRMTVLSRPLLFLIGVALYVTWVNLWLIYSIRISVCMNFTAKLDLRTLEMWDIATCDQSNFIGIHWHEFPGRAFAFSNNAEFHPLHGCWNSHYEGFFFPHWPGYHFSPFFFFFFFFLKRHSIPERTWSAY